MIVTISKYKKKIWQYEKRREASHATTRRLSMRICQMKARIATMEAEVKKTNKKIDSLIEAINDFFSVDIQSSKSDAVHKMARNVYYKLGLEMQFREVLICRKVNRSSKTASYHREVFTRSFAEKPLNKETFHNFKNYFKNKD